jgi:hypothetical protein
MRRRCRALSGFVDISLRLFHRMENRDTGLDSKVRCRWFIYAGLLTETFGRACCDHISLYLFFLQMEQISSKSPSIFQLPYVSR